MLPTHQHNAYCAFYGSVRDQDFLDEGTVAIIGLTAAFARECRP